MRANLRRRSLQEEVVRQSPYRTAPREHVSFAVRVDFDLRVRAIALGSFLRHSGWLDSRLNDELGTESSWRWECVTKLHCTESIDE